MSEKKKGVPKMENPPPPPKKTPPPVSIIPQPKKTRPTRKMTEDLFKEVCKEIESSIEGLDKICKRHNSSGSAFYDLMDDNTHLTEYYVRARKRQAEFLFDIQREVVFKRDEDHTPFTGSNVVGRDRLIMDAIKWQASKLNPRKYGDKLDVTTDGEKIESQPIIINLGIGSNETT